MLDKAIRMGDAKRMVNTEFKQFDRKFKHANEFQIAGNKNPKNIQLYKEALKKHLLDKNTRQIKGIYRGEKAIHFYNPKTKINLITKEKWGVLVCMEVERWQV